MINIPMSQEALAMTQTTKCIETTVLFVIAAAIVAYDKKLFFSKTHLTKESIPSDPPDKAYSLV